MATQCGRTRTPYSGTRGAERCAAAAAEEGAGEGVRRLAAGAAAPEGGAGARACGGEALRGRRGAWSSCARASGAAACAADGQHTGAGCSHAGEWWCTCAAWQM